MFNSFTFPTGKAIKIAEDIADDVNAKIFDLPSVFFPAVVIAVYTAALYDQLDTDLQWKRVYNAVDEFFEELFNEVTIFNRHRDVIAIDEDFPMIFINESEMTLIIKHLTETVIDGLSEYDLESNCEWIDLAKLLYRDFIRLPHRTDLQVADVELRLSRKSLFVIPNPPSFRLELI